MNRTQRPTTLFILLLVSLTVHVTWVLAGAPPRAWQAVLGNLSFFPPSLLAAALAWTLSTRLSGQARRAWAFFTAGLLFWAAGQGLYTWLDLTGASTFPSAADVGYLLLAPCFLLGVLHVWQPAPSRTLALSFLLDVAIIITAIGSLIWHFSVQRILDAYAATPFALAVAVAYPVSDLGLLALVLSMAVWRPRGLDRAQLGLIGGGLAGLFAAHSLYAHQAAQGLYHLGTPLDLLWTLAFTAFGTAAYVRLAAPGGTAPTAWSLPLQRRHRLNILLPTMALTLSYAVFLLAQGRDPLPGPLVTAAFVLLFLRQLLAVLDNGRLARSLAFQAGHDALTGLLNRSSLHAELDRRIGAAERQGLLVGVMFMDLDRMKYVNDAYGHAAGDEVLRHIAERLRASTRASDDVARFGGDEFVLTMTVRDTRQLTQVAQRLLTAVAQPVRFGRATFHVTASVGIAVCPADSADAATALHQADLAMYRAKAAGKNVYRFYDAQDHAAQREQVQLESHLREALRDGALDLHYQPIVSLAGGHLVGFEALLRWHSPLLGPVPPLTVVKLAEERAMMPELGAWVLSRAVQQVAEWRRGGQHPDLTVSVNVSASQFGLSAFVDQVTAALERHGVPGEALVLELTESTLIQDAAVSAQKMRDLRALGVRIALDDFGTGYSSLSYLRQLPVDVLKIDRSFVSILGDGGDGFVRAIVTLAHDQGVRVVAEGVEEAWQRDTLWALHCDLGQGYLFSRPLPAAQAEALLPAPLAVGHGN
ncbi:putative bifunctional diguanylate cyclase/phosphodiesterase [Deinococcus ficus]|uniref:putative bifunctional diguanylate cyclase/phosphodiesterase n=1 Tax=Deinococcus ficus TaxID=317577 RepID=UPI00138AD8D2|nr:bifunctional diguanylate cyclase/phosphodiesterase [Deinococcus ficus]